MKIAVLMTDRGRITLPASVRKELHIEGDTLFELETSGETIILRPALVIPRDDAWAYIPEHRAHVARASEQPAFAVSREELAAIADADDPEAEARRVVASHTNE